MPSKTLPVEHPICCADGCAFERAYQIGRIDEREKLPYRGEPRGKVVQTADEMTLLQIFRSLRPHRRKIALSVIRQMTKNE